MTINTREVERYWNAGYEVEQVPETVAPTDWFVMGRRTLPYEQWVRPNLESVSRRPTRPDPRWRQNRYPLPKFRRRTII